MGSLTAVWRIYPNALPPTSWVKDATALATQKFRFTRRTDQASSASFECSGSPVLVVKDRVFAYGLTDIAGALGAAITMGYASQYPPDTTATYVKATTEVSANYDAPQACDPAQDPLDGPSTHEWYSNPLSNPFNQRFHIDLGSAKVVKRVYYENSHNSGANTNRGIRAFTFWGSNNAVSFADLVYGDDAGWTLLATSVAEFDQHVAVDQLDPKYFTVTNNTAYRYYALKIATNWGESPQGATF
jgi:hypothetical protein